ncbi:MAG: hypothetical protein IIB16_01055, partial [Chloroflexi bacterium]|nr:hypothetical protein [Chloroflexota bacterium]
MSGQVKKGRDEDNEEIFDLRTAEVTLTGAPAVREDFLMTKAEVTLNDLELHGLASKLGVDGIEAIPEVEIRKAITLKVEEENEEDKKKGLHDDEEDPDKKGKVPPQFMKKAEDEEDEEEDEDKPLELGKSSVIRGLAPAMLTVKADLPKSLVRALEKSIEDGKAEDDEDKDEMKKNEALVEAMKSEMPGILKLVSEPLHADIKKSQERIATLESERDMVGFREIAKSMPGDEEKIAARLSHLSKSMNKADYDAFVEEQQGIFKTLEESDLLKSVQGRGVDATDPIASIQARAEAEVSKSGKAGDQQAVGEALTRRLESDPA